MLLHTKDVSLQVTAFVKMFQSFSFWASSLLLPLVPGGDCASSLLAWNKRFRGWLRACLEQEHSIRQQVRWLAVSSGHAFRQSPCAGGDVGGMFQVLENRGTGGVFWERQAITDLPHACQIRFVQLTKDMGILGSSVCSLQGFGVLEASRGKHDQSRSPLAV